MSPHQAASLARRLTLATLFVIAASPALALYKVVGPDGSVTYTDRPPTDGRSRVITLGSDPVSEVAAPDRIPLVLRQASTRFPVVLYTSTDCPPCEAGRRLLAQRGVPYTEKSVGNEDDAAALERTVGARSVPALTIGSQALRGLSSDEWNAYLDAAGYPRESLLPANWAPPTAQPMVTRTLLPAPRAVAAPLEPAAAPAPAPIEAVPRPPGALRF
jgi:glutaredoxin